MGSRGRRERGGMGSGEGGGGGGGGGGGVIEGRDDGRVGGRPKCQSATHKSL